LVTTKSSKAYGLDRAAYNQGYDALYDFSVEDELSPPLSQEVRARYAHVLPMTVGAICESDYKGIRNQDIDQEKYVVLVRLP